METSAVARYRRLKKTEIGERTSEINHQTIAGSLREDAVHEEEEMVKR